MEGESFDIPGTSRAIRYRAFVGTIDRRTGQAGRDPRPNDPAVVLEAFDGDAPLGEVLVPLGTPFDLGAGYALRPQKYTLYSGFQYRYDPVISRVLIGAIVLASMLVLRLERVYVIAIVILIALVLALELVNTAVEAVVDLLTIAHHPLAKTAKDAAAGAVLIATMAAVVVGYLTFYNGIFAGGATVYTALAQVPANTVLVILAIVVIGTIFAKAFAGRGSALQGGAVSGHAAMAFAVATIRAR